MNKLTFEEIEKLGKVAVRRAIKENQYVIDIYSLASKGLKNEKLTKEQIRRLCAYVLCNKRFNKKLKKQT